MTTDKCLLHPSSGGKGEEFPSGPGSLDNGKKGKTIGLHFAAGGIRACYECFNWRWDSNPFKCSGSFENQEKEKDMVTETWESFSPLLRNSLYLHHFQSKVRIFRSKTQ
ncbi:Uncharacterized protein TCM_016986 [Theobroma cacao]|uniref:Uncharacterized protein n=1 Tax=Theobroma cacao TaxID=3641 RepID=A0A061ED14_THECC|nr:Uncharacterized protein TCM_016986 [Theobroma cacao]